MSTKSKSLLVLFGTLVLGIVLGALSSGAIRHERMARFRHMPRQERFRHVLERIIEPTEEQRAALEQAVQRRFEQIADLREKFEDEIFAIHDSLRNDLASVLSADQLARLEAHLEKAPRMAIEERVHRLSRALELSESQAAQIKEIMHNMSASFQPPRISPDARRRHRRGMRARFEKMRAEIEAVLTPEQREKYRELMQHQPRPFPGRFPPPFPGPPPNHDFPDPGRERE
ncbi:MAG: hypothetical protein ACE5IY_09725 [bacterium]